MERPRALRRGDPVAIVAPSGPFERSSFERGLARLAERYRPIFDEELFSRDRYLAGTDARRKLELARAFSAPEICAVFWARGGYGAMRILPGLGLPSQNRLLVGFSDATALHCAFQASGRISVHGPVVTQLGGQPEHVVQALFELLEEPGARPALMGEPLVPGRVTGRVIGGNLSLLTRLLGTPYFPALDGAILFFEDVGERPYRLDRMWHHLALSGALDRLAGVALGSFTGCEEEGEAYTALEVMRELVVARGLPAVTGLPVGHGAMNLPFPLGARATLDGDKGTLVFEEGAVDTPCPEEAPSPRRDG
jgi:muramoyltetrapeptide carboxypeptidase